RVSQGGTYACNGFGIDAAPLGDVDHDGKADFAVAVFNTQSAAGITGGVILYLSSEGFPSIVSRFIVNRGGGHPHIAGLGDVNGDGIPDFAIGDGTVRVNFPGPHVDIWSGDSDQGSSPLLTISSSSDGFGSAVA